MMDAKTAEQDIRRWGQVYPIRRDHADEIANFIIEQMEQIQAMRGCDNCKNLGPCADNDDDTFYDCHKNDLKFWDWNGGSGGL